MNDKLTIEYEEFPEDGITVLTVARGDEAIKMFQGDVAKFLYNSLIDKYKILANL